MRVVIDTNVIISGFFFGGIPRDVLNLVNEGEIRSCFIPITFTELERIAWHSKFAEQRDVLDFSLKYLLKELKKRSLFFPQPKEMPQLIKENKADNYILACALACGADFIISGDKHLLDLKQFQGIRILKPQEFIEHIN